ncbi:jg22850, partial [Pararge aegeria aegeria]
MGILSMLQLLPIIILNFDYMAIGRFLRKNLVSITFPTLTLTCILLDWNHTRKWKAAQ